MSLGAVWLFQAAKRAENGGMTLDAPLQQEVITQDSHVKRGLRLDFNAPVVITFALLCLAALGLAALTNGASNRWAFSVYRASWSDPLTYVRFFGHALGHANMSHLLGNLMLLLVVGPPLEARYGHWRLLLLMAITALVSGLIQFLFFPGTSLLGASGIVFMMIVLASMSGMRAGYIPLTMIAVLLLYLGQELWQMFTVDSNVSHLTHIIGGITGAVCGFFLNRRVMEQSVGVGAGTLGSGAPGLPALPQVDGIIGTTPWVPSGEPVAEVAPKRRRGAKSKAATVATEAAAAPAKEALSQSDEELLKRLQNLKLD